MAGNRLTLDLVTPEKVAWSAPAEFVVLPAFEGEVGVLPGHAPLLVELKAGEVRITNDGAVQHFAVSGGFAEVKDDKIALFAETAEESQQIDQERARQALERVKSESAKRGLEPLELAELEAAARRAQVRLRVARRAKTVPPHLEER